MLSDCRRQLHAFCCLFFCDCTRILAIFTVSDFYSYYLNKRVKPSSFNTEETFMSANYNLAPFNNIVPHCPFCGLSPMGSPCLGPLKLCHYLLTKGVTENGTETVFG